MKKVIKWVVICLLIPPLLFLLITFLLYLPPVQNWAAKHVAEYASKKLDMDINVGHVRLKFPLDLQIDDFQAIKDNDSIPGLRDTIAMVEKMTVDVQLKPLFKKQVEIDALKLNNAKINTNGFIPDTRIKGKFGELSLQSHGINLNDETLKLDNAELLDADIDIALSDTVPPDTTETENNWKIFAENLKIHNSKVKVHLPGDTLNITAKMDEFIAKDGSFNLGEGDYKMAYSEWKGGALKYDNNFAKPVDGLDTNHIDITDLNVVVNSLAYKEPHLDLNLQSCTFKEKSGLQIDDLSGQIVLDSARVSLPSVNLRTPDSNISAQVELDLNAFDKDHPGVMYADLNGTIGKQDMLRYAGKLPDKVVRKWPSQPMMLSGKVRGNMNHADISGLHVDWPTALTLHADGYVENLDNLERMKLRARVNGKTGNLDFVSEMLDPDIKKTINIPQGIKLNGDIQADGNRYKTNMNIAQGNGNMKADVDLNTKTMSYKANIDANTFPVQNFVKDMPVGPLTGKIDVTGQGTDILSPSTSIKAKAQIIDFKYDKFQLNNMIADATIHNGKVDAVVDSHNSLLNGRVAFNAALNKDKLDGQFNFDLKNADLYTLRVADQPLVIAARGNLDIKSDLKESHSVRGHAENISLTYKAVMYRPDDMTLDVLTRPDTTYAYVDCGDFHLNMDGKGGYKKLLSQCEDFGNEIMTQTKDRVIDEKRLKDKLPQCNIYLESGNDNFFSDILEEQGYSFKNILVDMKSSPQDGLNGNIYVDSLFAEGYQLDTIRFEVETDSAGIRYGGQVRNNKDNPQYVFNSILKGDIKDGKTNLYAKVFDKNDKLGLDVGLRAAVDPSGIRFNLTDTSPVIGYMSFTANENNYIYLANDRRLSANLNLTSEEKTRLQVYTNDGNIDALQDLTVSVENLDLDRITSILPYVPDIKGITDGDFHIVQTESELTVSGDLGVKNLKYEGSDMGNINSEFVYMPNEDGSHFIDGILYKDNIEVGTLTGSYFPSDGGTMDAMFTLNHTPLSLVNGFIPDRIIGFNGYATGEMKIKGPMSKLAINGSMTPDSAYIYSQPYGVQMRMEEKEMRIVGNHLNFENYKLYSPNNNPLILDGSLDFTQLDHMFLDMRMSARDFQLINAKEQVNSEAFGKAFVNFFARMSGPVDALSMRGKLDVLGSTNMTYVLRDSPLAADNRLEELVKFVNFNDSVEQVVARPPLNGFTMDLSMSIDEAAQIKCDLNADHSNYIDLIGGGELRMQYNTIDDLMLTGRYTLTNGEMKYSLPIIPLKTFTIQDGSYIEFTGDPMNPRLHVTAIERTKATVADDGGGTRSVDFNCGVVLTQTLNDMGLEFVIDAIDDVTMSSELSSMSKEERGKVAVTMLTTGMYISDGNTSGFTMNGALSSFLQSEINNITGNALKSLNLSVGVDNATDASGNMHTDYSFKFAKRFWNNRLNISIGGKVSTGSEVEEQNQSFFNNVTFEYRLSPTSNKYLKMYYNRDAYDWLEGDVGEYGGGFLWKRKLDHFGDIFKFKNSNTIPSRVPRIRETETNVQPNDTIQNDNVDEKKD